MTSRDNSERRRRDAINQNALARIRRAHNTSVADVQAAADPYTMLALFLECDRETAKRRYYEKVFGTAAKPELEQGA